ncbi:unnamed protein product [Auanema sp. JU1783]|nr:unnamed protein product [Auanema sp. JU1783]
MAATEKNIENVELNQDVIDELSDASDIEITYFYDSKMNEGEPLYSVTSSNTKDTVLPSGFLDSEAGPSSNAKEESSHKPPKPDNLSEENSNEIKNKLSPKKFRQLIILRNKLFERAKQLGEREVNFDNEEEEESLVYEEIHVQQMILRLEKRICKARAKDDSSEMLTAFKCAFLPPIIISNSGNPNIDKKLTQLLESKRGPCMPIVSHDEVKDICRRVRDEELINDKQSQIPEASDEYLFPSYVTHLTALISKTIRSIAYDEDLKHYSEFLPEEKEEEIGTKQEDQHEGHALTKVLKMISDGGIENIINNEAEVLIDEIFLDSDEDEDEDELEYESEDEHLSEMKEEKLNENLDSVMEEDKPVNGDVDCPSGEQEQVEKVLDSLTTVDEQVKEVLDSLITVYEQVKELSDSPVTANEQVKDVLDSPITGDEQVMEVVDAPIKKEEQVKEVMDSPITGYEQVMEVLDSPIKEEEQVKEVLDSPITGDEQVMEVLDSPIKEEEQEKEVMESATMEKEQVIEVSESGMKENEQIKEVSSCTINDHKQVIASTDEPMMEEVDTRSKEGAQEGQEEGNEKQQEKVEQKEEQKEEQEEGDKEVEDKAMNEECEGSIKTDVLDDEARLKLQRETNAENRVFYNMSDFLKQSTETENDDIQVECVVGGFTTGGMTFPEDKPQKLFGVKLWLRNNDFPSNPNPSHDEIIEGPPVKRLRAEYPPRVENTLSNTVPTTARELADDDDKASSKSLEIICCINPRKFLHQPSEMELDGASQSRDSVEVVHEVNPRPLKRNQLIISKELLDNTEDGNERKSDSSHSNQDNHSSSSDSDDIEILPSSKCRRILTVEDLNKRREAYNNRSKDFINNKRDENASSPPHNNSVVHPSPVIVAPPSVSNPSPPSNIPYVNQVPELSFLPVNEPQSDPIPHLPTPDDDIIILN